MARFYNSELQKPMDTFVAAPTQLYAQNLQNQQSAQDKAIAQANDLAKPFGYLNTPEETKKANDIKSKVQQKTDEISNLNINNPQDRIKYMQGIKDIRSMYDPGGDAANLEASLNARKEHIKYLDEALKKKPEEGGINLKTYNYLSDQSLRGFDEQGGTSKYNQYKGLMPALNPDIDKQVESATKDWKSNAINKGYWTDKEGKQWAIKNSSDLEYIDPKEVKQSVLADIMARPENQAYAEQQSEIATYGKNDLSGYDSQGNPVSYRPGLEHIAKASEKAKVYNDIFEKPANLAAARLGFTKSSNDQDIKENSIYVHAANEKQINDSKQTYETSLSQIGPKGISNLSDISKSEPTNSVLSKIFNFVNPTNQAIGLLNMAKVLSPGIENNPSLKDIELKLKNKSNLSEDELNSNIEKVSYQIKQKIGEDQKSFRDKFGFSNPALNQAYNIVDAFGKGSDDNTTHSYERAKLIVESQDPSFKSLDKQQKFDKVKSLMDDFVKSSKLNAVVVPFDKKTLEFKNDQLANISGTPSEQTKQLMQLGVASNGKFLDFYTQKEVNLEDIVKSGQIKYIGQLDNNNQSGPAMDYYQGADGHYYVSPGSLEDRKKNYIDWSLHQSENRFNKEFKTPLFFEDSRDSRNFEKDGVTPKSNIPSINIENNLKTGSLNVTANVPDPKTGKIITMKAPDAANVDQAKTLIGIQLIKAGYTADQVTNLGF